MTDLADRRGIETEVYQPAEDSHLLATAAVERLDGDERVLEVGTGSGYVAVAAADETGADVVAADLNPHACRQARERAANEGVDVDVVRADLVAPFRDGAFDAVLFNPPYLPENEAAERDDWMEVALSGGETGRAVVDPFVDAVGRVVAPGGVVLLLVSTLTGYDEVIARANDRGFAAETVVEESYPFETLSVLALTRE
ncbi:methyltransferase [Halostella sp. JP-L12]|uniref:HemK2/MTQ2 family protein methyltransferase n=1 Tax=Halostella TaxID=1843185 RepID=UPI000EF8116B|nr:MULTISPECIES: HemK2/MTQ2 family protein methyltransferase [Halostella]NHN48998.1 methyltransferase [Halostella sp. JP-L12]